MAHKGTPMRSNKIWHELHASRFADLPRDCGNTIDPGMVDSEDLRDWSAKGTTPDQARMERYIDRYDLTDKRVLHIGIGNSGLARRLGGRMKELVGTTVDEPEIEAARSLGLPNYSVVLHNKYSGVNEAVAGKFDFILDNNPTSPCCCFRHLHDLFGFYAEKLAKDGQVVTDREGLGWIPDGVNPRCRFDFQDLAAVAEAAGFCAFEATGSVCVLSRSAPAAPEAGAQLRHALRRVTMLPGKLLGYGRRQVRRIGPRFVDSAMAIFAPRG
jgi:hypothetical protein